MFTEIIEDEDAVEGSEPRVTRYAGRTLDLSLFAVVRAVDVIVGGLWAKRKACTKSNGLWSNVSIVSPYTTDTILAHTYKVSGGILDI